MKLNLEKCSKDKDSFGTRLTVNETKNNQNKATIVLGSWIQEDAGQQCKNTHKLVKSVCSKVPMLTNKKVYLVEHEGFVENVCFICKESERKKEHNFDSPPKNVGKKFTTSPRKKSHWEEQPL